MKYYRLAVDENGSPFVLNSKGSIDFGYITDEMNLPPAPIRIAEGATGPKGYGLKHIIEGHSKEIIGSGYETVNDFIEDVAGTFTEIKEGRAGSFLLEKGDMYHNTLFIALSKEGDYWKVISGGVFRTRYSKNKRIIHSASEVLKSSPAEDDLSPFEDIG
ncbi:MAG: hypothetical protein IJ504_06595 [Bacteroidales bacterium]|nr:hypothetical protein [Bacteroidales bacterium]